MARTSSVSRSAVVKSSSAERRETAGGQSKHNATKLYRRGYSVAMMQEAISRNAIGRSAKHLTKSHVCKIFDEYDEDGSGHLNYEEAHRAMTELSLPQTNESFLSLKTVLGVDVRHSGIDKHDFLLYCYTVNTQRRFRDQSRRAIRLHCKHLSERLLLENHIVHGTFRLVNQLIIFAFLLVAISFGSDPSVKRGVYNEMADAFGFDKIMSTKLRSQVYEELRQLSDTSKDYMLLSNRYFDSGKHGPLTLLGPIRSFSTSQVMGGVDLTVQVPAFSFSAWVKSTPQFVRGFIVRKRLVSAGDGQDLSCWGWRLDKTSGPGLSFGVHDMFPVSADLSQNNPRELDVGLTEVPFPAETFFLLSIIVNSTHATFHQDNRLLGTVAMPRPLTDCFNNFEGLLLGSAGLTLGEVRFYPFALTPASIEEILVFGSQLEDISSGFTPLYAQETSMDVTRRSLRTTTSSVDASLQDRQYALEISQVVQAVDAQPGGEDFSVPSLAAGGWPANSWNATSGGHVPSTDISGREYHLLLRGPRHLGRLQDDEQRYLTKVPSFVGTGCTFTWWYRHVDCKSSSCGGYVLYAGDFLFWRNQSDVETPDPVIYWSIWVEDEGIWLDSPGKGYYWFDDSQVTPKFRPNGDRIWRHMALQFDQDANSINFFLDGVLALSERQPDKSIRDVDKLTRDGYDTVILLGHADPNYSEAIQCDIADLRMYPHTHGVLSARIIQAIASASSQLVAPRCVSSADLRDELWKDSLGHDCLWFSKARQVQPSVCRLKEAAERCPISCRSQQECFQVPDEPTPRFVFDAIQRIEASSANGTMCLGRRGKGYPAAADDEKQAVLAACREFAANGLDEEMFAAWLDSMVDAQSRPTTGREGRRLNLTDCEELEQAVDEYCVFDLAAVEDFTKDVLANGGEYSIGFWVKPLGGESEMHGSGQFHPHLMFYADAFPPKPQLSLSKTSLGPFGEFRTYSSCAVDEYEGTYGWASEVSALADMDGWTFYAYSSTNLTDSGDTPQQFKMYTNLWERIDNAEFRTCLHNPTYFFTALEVNYDMLLSPIMLIPKVLTASALQTLYLKNEPEMQIRTGPLRTNRRRASARVKVTKLDFKNRAALLAPPMIFQTRGTASADCKFNASTAFIQKQYRSAMQAKCAPPYTCSRVDPTSLISCDSKTGDANGSYFGIQPITFKGAQGYADFLYSIADHDHVSRDGVFLRTVQFIDSLSAVARVVLVFFSPQSGMLTMLEVQSDMSGSDDVRTTINVDHYTITEGEHLHSFLATQVVMLLNIFFMLVDVFFSLRKILQQHMQGEGGITLSAFIYPMLDILVSVLVTIYAVLRISSTIGSRANANRILSAFGDIPWADPEVPMEAKQGNFVGLVTDLTELIDQEVSLDTLCSIILVFNLLRVIECTNVHPRLALLTGTLQHAYMDLWHTAILTISIMSCFAGVATWRFGPYLEEFSSFKRTMQTEFIMLFGSIEYVHWTSPGNPHMLRAELELQLFVTLYLLVIFLLILNFLLAIIVDAYAKVRQDQEHNKTELECLTDIRLSMAAALLGKYHAWPDSKLLGSLLGTWVAKNSVGRHELRQSGLFRGYMEITAFLNFYSEYDFLVPEHVGKYGRAAGLCSAWNAHGGFAEDDSALLLQMVSGRMKEALGVRNFTLQEELAEARELVRRRSQKTGEGKGEGDGEGEGEGKGKGTVGSAAEVDAGVRRKSDTSEIQTQFRDLKKQMHTLMRALDAISAAAADRSNDVDVDKDTNERAVPDEGGGSSAGGLSEKPEISSQPHIHAKDAQSNGADEVTYDV